MKRSKLFPALLSLLGILILGFFFFSFHRGVDPSLVRGTMGVVEDPEVPKGDDQPALWLGPDGSSLPFGSDAEIEEFLRTAEVVSSRRIREGINGVEKLLLEKDGVRSHAAFRDVRVRKTHLTLADGTYNLNFRDDCLYEVAAYRISRMLGLDNVPPAVKRSFRRRPGTLQLWVEEAMSEKTRIKQAQPVPRSADWTRQIQTMYLFDQLIANFDRNQGNILIDPDWKLWMIDHTRSFRLNKKPRSSAIVVQCDRRVWERLQDLDLETVQRELKGVLTGREIRALFQRRDALIQHIQSRIERLGEQSVLL